MSYKRMVEYHINRLQDKRDNIRAEAIKELVLLNAIESLDQLESIYRNDPNESVRRAAKEAGKKLFALQLIRDKDRELEK